jgi:hypothetical protein
MALRRGGFSGHDGRMAAAAIEFSKWVQSATAEVG